MSSVSDGWSEAVSACISFLSEVFAVLSDTVSVFLSVSICTGLSGRMGSSASRSSASVMDTPGLQKKPSSVRWFSSLSCPSACIPMEMLAPGVSSVLYGRGVMR